MDMKQIIKLFLVLSLVLLASCSTQQRVVYRDCDCNTTTFGFGWNTNPYWGLNDTYWSWNRWNSWNYSPYQVIPRYYIYPNRVQPSQPSRYERRQSVGARPSRNSIRTDNVYPQRTPHMQNMDMDYTQQQSQPVYRNTTPSRVQSNPTRTTQQRTTQPNRVETPSRVQQRQNTPVTTQPTRSRVQNREN
jgi:hypothetical protein